jgi:hypothetical protein
LVLTLITGLIGTGLIGTGLIDTEGNLLDDEFLVPDVDRYRLRLCDHPFRNPNPTGGAPDGLNREMLLGANDSSFGRRDPAVHVLLGRGRLLSGHDGDDPLLGCAAGT